MAFCSNCGTKVESTDSFCPSCGTQVNAAPAGGQTAAQGNAPGGAPNNAQNEFKQNMNNKVKGFLNTKDFTNDFDPNERKQNQVMAVLAYIGILVLIPIFGAKESKYARFHANQGLVLLIASVAYGILRGILDLVLQAIFPLKLNMNASSFFNLYTRSPLYGLFSFILWLPTLALLGLFIFGVVNACKNRAKELPLIGSFRILK